VRQRLGIKKDLRTESFSQWQLPQQETHVAARPPPRHPGGIVWLDALVRAGKNNNNEHSRHCRDAVHLAIPLAALLFHRCFCARGHHSHFCGLVGLVLCSGFSSIIALRCFLRRPWHL
ncbi:hypothetical protein TcCL_Unassigned00849, partial [Trypanosoma cruzi]